MIDQGANLHRCKCASVQDKRHKKMLRAFSMLSVCILLSSCLEDRGALVSACALRYKGVEDDVLLCMREKGYEFENWWVEDNGSKKPNVSCYMFHHDSNGTIIPTPLITYYYAPGCYHRVFFFDVDPQGVDLQENDFDSMIVTPTFPAFSH
jgi:hypothetical protein